METAQTVANHQNLRPQDIQQPPPAADPPPPNISSRKRPRDDDFAARLVDSPYYKMRAIVRDLRPHFVEVLKTPDFQNCKAAEEIRAKMKIVMDLYKEIIAEPPIPDTFKNVAASHPSTGENQNGQEHRPNMKPPEKPPSDRAFTRHAENKTGFSGTYIVGGSAFGWNFVTFPGSKAIYYGQTKESFRSANQKSQA